MLKSDVSRLLNDVMFYIESYSAGAKAPKHYLSDLKPFLNYAFYDSFSDYYNYTLSNNLDLEGLSFDNEKVLIDPTEYEKFKKEFYSFYLDNVPFDRLEEPLLIADFNAAADRRDAGPDHFILLNDIGSISDFINFINDILADFGDVNAAGGLKTEYKIVKESAYEYVRKNYTVKALSEYAVIPSIFRDFTGEKAAVFFAKKCAKKYNHVYISFFDPAAGISGFINPGPIVAETGETWHTPKKEGN